MQSEPRNIGSVIADLAKINPDAPCVEQDGTCYTRADFIASAQSLAVFFKEQGVGVGASIAIVAVDRVKGFQAAIALWSLEAAVLFLDPRQPIEELKASQEKAGVEAIFTDSKSFSRRGGFGLLPAVEPLLNSDPELHFPVGSFDRDALILSSSGTTGMPRFRRVSHRVFLDGLFASGELLDARIPFPAVTVGSLAFGAVLSHWIKLMIHGKFNLSLPLIFKMKELHQALNRTDIQSVGLPPVIIRDLLKFHSENISINDGPAYPHLKHMTSVGGPISSENLVQAYQVLTNAVKNVYSLTGVGPVSLLSGTGILEKPNSVGKPLSGVTVRIEMEDNELCPIGEVGRIVATANWQNGAVAIDTGDLGSVDEDGYLFVHGRSAQIASRNSINVSLSDVEQDVKKISGVRDCIAFSVQADDSMDDLIYLAVECDADTISIKGQIRATLATYRRPDKIMMRAHLPRNAADKISLRNLKEMAIEKDTDFADF